MGFYSNRFLVAAPRNGDAFPYVAAVLKQISARCSLQPLKVLMLGLFGLKTRMRGMLGGGFRYFLMFIPTSGDDPI